MRLRRRVWIYVSAFFQVVWACIRPNGYERLMRRELDALADAQLRALGATDQDLEDVHELRGGDA